MANTQSTSLLIVLLTVSLAAGCQRNPTELEQAIADARAEWQKEQDTLTEFFSEETLPYVRSYVGFEPIIPAELEGVELKKSQRQFFDRVVAFDGDSNSRIYTPQQLAFLPRFKHLQSFRTFDEPTDETLRMLGRVKSLEVLMLDGRGKYSAKGYRELSKLPNLKRLGVLPDIKDDESLAAICRCVSLEELSVDHCFGVSPKGFREIGKLRRLQTLTIRGDLSREAVEPWPALEQLVWLDISGLNDESLDVICDISSLQSLDIFSIYNDITSHGLQSVGRLTGLRVLSVGVIKQPEDLAFLTRLARLESLVIYSEHVVVLEVIPKIPQLKYLDFTCYKEGADEARAKLQRMCPDLIIEPADGSWDDGHPEARDN